MICDHGHQGKKTFMKYYMVRLMIPILFCKFEGLKYNSAP